MGWKNVQTHYGIMHYVRVTEAGICIGSGYVHDLIVIAETDKRRDWRDTVDRRETAIGHNISIWRPTYLGRGEPFDGIVKAMADDPEALRRLIDAPDTFEKSIKVYTYDYDGNIIEKLCEEPGWPNATHDGAMQYENTFSTDRDQVVEWARRNNELALENARERVKQAARDFDEANANLAKREAAVAKLKTA